MLERLIRTRVTRVGYLLTLSLVQSNILAGERIINAFEKHKENKMPSEAYGTASWYQTCNLQSSGAPNRTCGIYLITEPIGLPLVLYGTFCQELAAELFFG